VRVAVRGDAAGGSHDATELEDLARHLLEQVDSTVVDGAGGFCFAEASQGSVIGDSTYYRSGRHVSVGV
jgi:dethiobiotin synthetase